MSSAAAGSSAGGLADPDADPDAPITGGIAETRPDPACLKPEDEAFYRFLLSRIDDNSRSFGTLQRWWDELQLGSPRDVKSYRRQVPLGWVTVAKAGRTLVTPRTQLHAGQRQQHNHHYKHLHERTRCRCINPGSWASGLLAHTVAPIAPRQWQLGRPSLFAEHGIASICSIVLFPS